MAGYSESWFAIAGQEIANADRVATYLRRGLAPPGVDVGNCHGCPGIGLAVEDVGFTGYRSPAEDDAPWYDPAVPESANFAGLLVTKISGFDSPYKRDLVATLGGGGAIGPLKIQPRTVVVEGVLIGRTCCSVSYGMRWLVSALAGPTDGCDTCTPAEFCFLTCCPDAGEVTPCVPGAEPSEDETFRYDDFFRTACNAGLLEGPKIVNELGHGCGCGGCVALEVEFTLGMGPWMFGDPIDCMVDELFDLDEDTLICIAEFEECEGIEVVEDCPDCGAEITFVEGCTTPACDACSEPEPCLDDPLCPIPTAPPAPPLLAPLCSDVYCQPAFVSRLTCDVDASLLTQWGDAVLSLEIHAGSESLRNLRVLAFPNPQLRPIDETFSDCDACVGFFVSYVPCNSTLRIDGACQTATIDCDGVVANAERNLAAVDGTTFDWITLSCGSWTIVVDADAANTALDATVSVQIIRRSA